MILDLNGLNNMSYNELKVYKSLISKVCKEKFQEIKTSKLNRDKKIFSDFINSDIDIVPYCKSINISLDEFDQIASKIWKIIRNNQYKTGTPYEYKLYKNYSYLKSNKEDIMKNLVYVEY